MMKRCHIFHKWDRPRYYKDHFILGANVKVRTCTKCGLMKVKPLDGGRTIFFTTWNG